MAMLETFETVTKAVSAPNRVRILKLLEAGELCVCQISTALGVDGAAVSKGLAALKTAGLVQQRREGRWAYYRLATRDLNRVAPLFLDLLRRTLADDPTIAEDKRVLAQVNAVPLQILCDQGRAALPMAGPMAGEKPAAACCNRVS